MCVFPRGAACTLAWSTLTGRISAHCTNTVEQDWFSNTSTPEGCKTLWNLSKWLLISEETFTQLFATAVTKAYEEITKVVPQSLYKNKHYATGAKTTGQSGISTVPYPSWGFQTQSENETLWQAQEWPKHLWRVPQNTDPQNQFNIQNKARVCVPLTRSCLLILFYLRDWALQLSKQLAGC